ncbi:MAG: YhjD/YihY/BrkB family envelope integrity protein [Rhodospirillales bacterium]|nr:YhjD/YihY/BrkB family envelope integrity protein [Rhodospirillales bacterium]MDP6882796.1 YhjD/YihY/BrkB family envelope integrity protein [Rhodospirillales bacterium]
MSLYNRQALQSSLGRLLWGAELATLPRWKAEVIGFLRILHGVARALAEGQLSLRAMSLVYTTLLSLVPLLAISFSVLKGFGVHNQIEPMLLSALRPFGEMGVEITTRIIGFVEKVKVGVLGSVGLGFLIYTVISLMQKIERSFNFTWHVTQQRSLAERFSEYISVIVVGPVLVFSALGITASVMSTTVVEGLAAIEPFGALIKLAGKVVPYVLIVGAFTFVYVFMPNTKVRLRSAFVGALIAGAVWETAGWAFASFIVGSTKYTAIYSAFATLILFMIWLYFSWLILLVGASISFYHQNPEHLNTLGADRGLSNRMKEKLALMVGALISAHHYQGQAAWTLDELARHLRVSSDALESVMVALEEGGLVIRTAETPPAYLPARPFDTTEVAELLRCVRRAEEQEQMNYDGLPSRPAVEQLMERLDRAGLEALGGRTLKELGTDAADAPEKEYAANDPLP